MGTQNRDEPVFEPGTRVEVLNRFEGNWCRSFEVAHRDQEGYQVRRLSDGHVLPEVFPPDGVRAAR